MGFFFDRTTVDGLISFFASHHALRAEVVLKRGGFVCRLVPGPKELSPNCGVALRFEYGQREDVLALLASSRVRVDSVHVYRPRTDGWAIRDVEGHRHPERSTEAVGPRTDG